MNTKMPAAVIGGALIATVGFVRVNLAQSSQAGFSGTNVGANKVYITDRRVGDFTPFIPSSKQVEEARQAPESRVSDEDVQGNWSSPSDGFQMSVRLGKVIFTNGEPITARILVRNISDKPLEYDFSDPRNFDFEFSASRDGLPLESKDSPHPNQLMSEKIRELASGKRHFAELPVGTQREFVFNLEKTFALTASGQYKLLVQRSFVKPGFAAEFLNLTTNWQNTPEENQRMEALHQTQGSIQVRSGAEFSVLEPPIPREAHLWGPVSEGFRVIMRVPETSLKIGGSIPLRFVIRNVSALPLWYPDGRDNPQIILTDGRAKELKTRAGEAVSKPEVVNYLHAQMTIDRWMEREYQIRLDEVFDIKDPDRYTVFVRFKVPVLGTDRDSTNPTFSELVSPTLPLMIEENIASTSSTTAPSAHSARPTPGSERLWRGAFAPIDPSQSEGK
jgi:hypothetical protein